MDPFTIAFAHITINPKRGKLSAGLFSLTKYGILLLLYGHLTLPRVVYVWDKIVCGRTFGRDFVYVIQSPVEIKMLM